MPFADELIAAGGIVDVIDAFFIAEDEIDLAAHRAHIADIAPPADVFFVDGLVGKVHAGGILADAAFFDVVHAPGVWADFVVAQIAEDEAAFALIVLDGFDHFDAGAWFFDLNQIEPSLVELVAGDAMIFLDFEGFVAFGIVSGFVFEEQIKAWLVFFVTPNTGNGTATTPAWLAISRLRGMR